MWILEHLDKMHLEPSPGAGNTWADDYDESDAYQAVAVHNDDHERDINQNPRHTHTPLGVIYEH